MVEKKTGSAEPHQFTEDTVPCLMQDLSGLPPHQAAAVFYETVGQAFPIKLLGPTDAPLRYRDAAYILSDMMLCTTDLGAAEVNRSRAFAARSGIDSYVLSFLIRGKSGVPSSGAATQAGDLLVMDLAQPMRVIGTECSTFSISISRHLLTPVLKTPDEHNMRIFSGEDPLVALLRSYLWDLYARMPNMSLVQAQATVAPTMQLLAAALNGAVTEEAVGNVRQAQTEQIRRYINAHLLESGLTVESIAATFGMSVRKLHYLFEPHGGVMAYVHRQRLQHARAVIADPVQMRRSIQDIAEDHGFHHRKNFIAAFRRTFDMTPSEARAYGQRQRRMMSAQARFAHRWEWYGLHSH